jgi:predicted phosphodiesterase
MDMQRIRRKINASFLNNGYSNDSKDKSKHYDSELLECLEILSNILKRCKIKSLLLPPLGDYDIKHNDFIMSENTMHKLVDMHPWDSCLILQPRQAPQKNKISILNAFPYFEVALRNINLWPAVLLWDKNNYSFIPVEDFDELINIYQIIKYEKNPLMFLNQEYGHESCLNHIYFHLSDLHFGNNNLHLAQRRLKTLVKKQMKEIGPYNNFDVIITGDMVDSPKESYYIMYKNFADEIEAMIGRPPISVIGNHDIYNYGLALLANKKTVTQIISEFSNEDKIIIDDEQKVIFLKFNSVTDKAFLAEGKIGSLQLAEMGNELDKISNIHEYTLIALLHHHVTNIPKPDWYDKKWFQKLMPVSVHDETVKLIDSDIFLEWLKLRDVRLVMHGHKHIPYVEQDEQVNIVACGSSTGNIAHKEKEKTYISYNVININKKNITCMQYAEEIYGSGAKHINTSVFKL